MLRRALGGAGLDSVLEPAGLDRGDGRRPDGMTLFPFSRGKSLVWDATCSDTFSATAVIQSALNPGSAARCAEERKRARYAALSDRFIFVPFAVETTGVLGPAAVELVKELGRRLTARSGDGRETMRLAQRISIAVARGNAASVLATAKLAGDASRHAPPQSSAGPAPLPSVPANPTQSLDPAQPLELASPPDRTLQPASVPRASFPCCPGACACPTLG